MEKSRKILRLKDADAKVFRENEKNLLITKEQIELFKGTEPCKKMLNLSIKHLITTNLDDFESFSCGYKLLDNFLKNDSVSDQEKKLGVTYLVFIKNDLAGYFTLKANSIEVLEINTVNGIEKFKEDAYPAIEILYLAIDKRFKGKGIGKCTLQFALSKIVSISKEIGCRYVIVDSVKDKIGFYEKYGFKRVYIYNDEFIKMYLNIWPILKEVNNKVIIKEYVKGEIK